MLARHNAHNPNLHALFNARRADIRPYGEHPTEIVVSGTEGIRAAKIGAVQGAPAWHGEYRAIDGRWGKVRNNDAKAICYSTPEYALAAARLYRDEELVRHEAAFGQDQS